MAVVERDGAVAVLWDMDGTLLDSEPVHQQAIMDALCAHGIEAPKDLHEATLGMESIALHAWLRRTRGLNVSFEAWTASRNAAFLSLCADIQPREEALQAWEAFARAGLRQAIVSNSDRVIVNAGLASAGIVCDPSLVVAREDVARGKPAPDPYLEALKRLQVPSHMAVAVEDSPTGATSALAAGLYTVFVPQMASEGPVGVHRVQSISDFADRLLAARSRLHV